jgi:hypothetical protein
MITQRKYTTEAEIQAILYAKLTAAGLVVGLEQNVHIEGETRFGKRQKIRIDVAIFDEHQIIGCIEVKSDRRKTRPKPSPPQNGWRYRIMQREVTEEQFAAAIADSEATVQMQGRQSPF